MDLCRRTSERVSCQTFGLVSNLDVEGHQVIEIAPTGSLQTQLIMHLKQYQ